MKFVSKHPEQYFWIENYTPEEKEFFKSIGFTEPLHNKRLKGTLTYIYRIKNVWTMEPRRNE